MYGAKRPENGRRNLWSVATLVTASACLQACGTTVLAAEPVEGTNFKIAGKTSRAIQKYTGLTFATDLILSTAGSVATKCVLHGKPKCKVRSYSFTDALSGKFKHIEVKLRHCTYQGVPLPDLTLANLTPIRTGSKYKILTPVMVSVAGQADEQLISRALQTPAVSSRLNFLRFDLPGLGDQHLQVLNPQVKLDEGKICIDTQLVTSGAAAETGIKVAISAKPVLKEERFIELQETRVDSNDIIEPEKFSVFAQDLLNPLVDFGRMDRNTRAFRLTDFHTDDHKVNFAGKLLLAPKPVPDTNQSGKKKQ